MNYSGFTTLSKATQQLGLRQRKQLLFGAVPVVDPSVCRIEALYNGEKMGFFTEKAKPEFIIAPILPAVRRNAHGTIGIFSGAQLMVESANLHGYRGFILSNNPDSYDMSTPIFCLAAVKTARAKKAWAGALRKCTQHNSLTNTPIHLYLMCVGMYRTAMSGFSSDFSEASLAWTHGGITSVKCLRC